jgi:hypothetical protein
MPERVEHCAHRVQVLFDLGSCKDKEKVLNWSLLRRSRRLQYCDTDSVRLFSPDQLTVPSLPAAGKHPGQIPALDHPTLFAIIT